MHVIDCKFGSDRSDYRLTPNNRLQTYLFRAQEKREDMTLSVLTKIAAGAAVSMALVAGIAPGAASATGSSVGVNTGSLGVWDTGSVGIESDAPGLLHPTQLLGGVGVMVTNPVGFVGDCAPVLVEVGQAFRLISDPSSVLEGGPGITLFRAAELGHWSSVAAVDPGVYVLAGICTGLPATDIAIQVMEISESGLWYVSSLGSVTADLLVQSIRSVLGS